MAKQVAISHESLCFLIVASSKECKSCFISYVRTCTHRIDEITHGHTHWSLCIIINSDESCFGGPLITYLRQKCILVELLMRIHNHFWSFCTRVDCAKRMNHIPLKVIQEFLQARLIANSTIQNSLLIL